MVDRLWLLIFGYSSLVTHLWLLIFGYSSLVTHLPPTNRETCRVRIAHPLTASSPLRSDVPIV
ncbi:MAG: hypothetical protein EA001_00660 [Oscillatoriales cyanobacterium]|nr:MAG: hypothetical protein EA001_00660 [Oscillatoriales cyanobacterium]